MGLLTWLVWVRATCGSRCKQKMEATRVLCFVKPTGALIWSCSCQEQTCWGFSFDTNNSGFRASLSDSYMTEPIRRRKPVSCCVLKSFWLQPCSPPTPFLLPNLVFISHLLVSLSWWMCVFSRHVSLCVGPPYLTCHLFFFFCCLNFSSISFPAGKLCKRWQKQSWS